MKITIELFPNSTDSSEAVHAALLNLLTVTRRDAVENPFGPDPRAGGTSSDDADERVRGDWWPIDAGGSAPPVLVDGPSGTEIALPAGVAVEAGGEAPPIVVPATIPRAQVVLRVGDKCLTGNGHAITVTGDRSDRFGGFYPITTTVDINYCFNGRCYADQASRLDIVEVNGVRIIDEEADRG